MRRPRARARRESAFAAASRHRAPPSPGGSARAPGSSGAVARWPGLPSAVARATRPGERRPPKRCGGPRARSKEGNQARHERTDHEQSEETVEDGRGGEGGLADSLQVNREDGGRDERQVCWHCTAALTTGSWV